MDVCVRVVRSMFDSGRGSPVGVAGVTDGTGDVAGAAWSRGGLPLVPKTNPRGLCVPELRACFPSTPLCGRPIVGSRPGTSTYRSRVPSRHLGRPLSRLVYGDPAPLGVARPVAPQAAKLSAQGVDAVAHEATSHMGQSEPPHTHEPERISSPQARYRSPAGARRHSPGATRCPPPPRSRRPARRRNARAFRTRSCWS